jgi:deoxycytidine triphosphate deaminase
LIKTEKSVSEALKKVKCMLNLIMNGLKYDIKVGIVFNYRRKENNGMIDLLGGNSVKI